MKINKFIDHTVLSQDADEKKIDKLIAEAKEHDFASVCVNSCWTKKCAEALKDSDVNVCVVVGFPLGAMDTKSKAFETKTAIENGADEIDMVINVGWLKSGRYSDVENDIREVKKACGDKHLKVIIECCLLTDEEKVKACELSERAGADFVKTSTGFSKSGATVEDVALMRKTVGDRLGVKAAGGIRDGKTAVAMIKAGASRLGCSAGIKIIEETDPNAEY
ncbi:MAG: deoxyribose-phosphate aldolase [Spirochaetales bacterium]|nr:deoxyribose-phosphate aldolase [Spirochaetales bacterium]MDD6840828.1 deoxyribose-phosphate aldolase [Spirochaetales bacterium]